MRIISGMNGGVVNMGVDEVIRGRIVDEDDYEVYEDEKYICLGCLCVEKQYG